MQSIKYLYIISATIEENKTDKKEDKQSTSDKDKLKDVCVIPEQRFDSQTKSGKRNKYYNNIYYIEKHLFG